jgi:hypothetical protein
MMEFLGKLGEWIMAASDWLAQFFTAVGEGVLYPLALVVLFVSTLIFIVELLQYTPVRKTGFPWIKLAKYEQRWHPRFIGIIAILGALKIVLRIAGMGLPIIPGVLTLEFTMFLYGTIGTVFGVAGMIGWGIVGHILSDIFVGTLNPASIGAMIGAFVGEWVFFKLKPDASMKGAKQWGRYVLSAFLGVGFFQALSVCVSYQIFNLLPVELIWGFALPLYYIAGVLPTLIGYPLLVGPIHRLADRFGFTWQELGYKIKGE